MLTKRVIPCLDVRAGRVTKGVKFKNNVDLGDPVEMGVRYSDGGAYIEAGNNAFRQHDSHSFMSSRPILPDFSGWNWQAQRRPLLTIAVNFTPAYSVTPAVSGTTSA